MSRENVQLESLRSVPALESSDPDFMVPIIARVSDEDILSSSRFFAELWKSSDPQCDPGKVGDLFFLAYERLHWNDLERARRLYGTQATSPLDVDREISVGLMYGIIKSDYPFGLSHLKHLVRDYKSEIRERAYGWLLDIEFNSESSLADRQQGAEAIGIKLDDAWGLHSDFQRAEAGENLYVPQCAAIDRLIGELAVGEENS